MSRRITYLSAAILALFVALVANLNLITLVQGDELANHPSNRRLLIQEYAIERGPIVAGDEAIAASEETDGTLRYRRRYPDGPLYAHLTGYYSFLLGRANLESAMNEALTGRSTEVLAQRLDELLGLRDEAGNIVELTIDPAVQRAARDALDGRTGAVVAIDPSSGAVLGSYANPTFDPGPLSSHDGGEVRGAWEQLEGDDSQPLLDRTRQQTYPPGSAFKLITAAAGLEEGVQPSTSFPDEPSYDVPQTSSDIGNFGGGTCVGGGSISLAEALRVSCNTTFARLAVDLGDDALLSAAEAFGFNRTPPYELAVEPSAVPKSLDVPQTAQSGIGQRDVRATPLQMAMAVGAIVNDGELMRPHVVQAVRDPSGRRLRGPDVGAWDDGRFSSQAVSPRTASQLREMMRSVVESGTGTAAAIDGVDVGGKTGTAQTGGDPVAWFVGHAGSEVAVAVAVPDAGPDATGGSVAAPIARAVMQAAVGS